MPMTLKTAARCGSLLIVLAIPFSASDGGAAADSRAARCSYKLWPLSLSFDASGGRAVVRVTTEDFCTWIADSDRAWIAISSPASGSGEGTVTLIIADNPGSVRRTGTLTIGGEVVLVAEEGIKPQAMTKRAHTRQRD